MKRLAVKQFLEQYIPQGVPIFPNEFPTEIDTCYSFDYDGATNLRGELAETHLIVHSRSKNPDQAEQLSLDVLENLRKVTNVDIDGNNLVLVRAVGKHATYGGKDENNRYYYMTRYRLLVD